jgi:hypothetical protein
MIPEHYKNFLIGQARTKEIRHSKRTLYDHLVGTHDLLRKWGADDRVCDAGLFHSIYGTARFVRAAMSIYDRDIIKNLIGVDAERLVYLFCVLDRPEEIVEGKNSLFYASDKMLRELREIEAANLIEQGSKSKWLRKLLDTDISDDAKYAIREYLACGVGGGGTGEVSVVAAAAPAGKV